MKIKNYTFGDRATMILKFSNIQIKKTASGAEYASLLGYDGEDNIEVKIWSLNDERKANLKNGEIYEASGNIKDYQGKMQLNISEFRRIEDDEDIDREAFYEFASIDIEELQNQISSYIEKIDNEVIKNIVVRLIKQNYKDYFMHPAAMSMHHNYYYGLAYHVYSMLKLSDACLRLYSYLNRDLVYAGIIIHDIGKLIELTGPKGIEYTKQGNLLGHISIGSNMLFKAALELGYEDTEEYLALNHIVLAHHGQNDYGSPKEPLIAEAALIYLLDFTDSRLASLEKEILSTEEGNYTNPIATFDRKAFYVPKIK